MVGLTPLLRFMYLIREAVAVFDWAMENMSIWASVDIESRNAKTLGRAYTCGVSNMGRYPFETQVALSIVPATCLTCYVPVVFLPGVVRSHPAVENPRGLFRGTVGEFVYGRFLSMPFLVDTNFSYVARAL